jgi:uncharacterized protein
MKKTLFTTLFILLSFIIFSQNQQSYTGNWLGVLNAGGAKLRIGLSVTDSAGVFTSFLMSPDQGVMKINVEKTSLNNDTLLVKCKDMKASFKGKLNYKADSLIGFWIQGRKFPLSLGQVEKLPSMNRPQEPKKPYPYAEEEVSFTDAKTGITFSGTLTLPQGQKKYPAVVLVTGSGPQNRDEELLGHKPFWVIADYLTRQGIAVLRYDDRGTFQSKGVFATATTEDFSKDAEAAYNFLLKEPGIDAAKVGIMGHSEGGMIAPMVASRNKSVAFVVMLAGPGLTGQEILLLQSELIQKADSTPQSEIDINNALNKKMYAIALKEKDDKKAADKMRVLIDEYWKTLSPEAIAKNNLDKKQLVQSVYQILTPWFRYFLKSDPSKYLVKVKCPVLAVNGSKDLQVPPKQDLEAITKYLTKAGNKNFTTHEFEGLNHLFQHAQTGSPTEYSDIEETFAPEALEYIGKWILEQTKK